MLAAIQKQQQQQHHVDGLTAPLTASGAGEKRHLRGSVSTWPLCVCTWGGQKELGGCHADRVVSFSSPFFCSGEAHGLLITVTWLNHPLITIWNFTPHLFLYFLSFFFVLFAVDIPCVLFVFIYDYLQKKRMA